MLRWMWKICKNVTTETQRIVIDLAFSFAITSIFDLFLIAPVYLNKKTNITLNISSTFLLLLSLARQTLAGVFVLANSHPYIVSLQQIAIPIVLWNTSLNILSFVDWRCQPHCLWILQSLKEYSVQKEVTHCMNKLAAYLDLNGSVTQKIALHHYKIEVSKEYVWYFMRKGLYVSSLFSFQFWCPGCWQLSLGLFPRSSHILTVSFQPLPQRRCHHSLVTVFESQYRAHCC